MKWMVIENRIDEVLVYSAGRVSRPIQDLFKISVFQYQHFIYLSIESLWRQNPWQTVQSLPPLSSTFKQPFFSKVIGTTRGHRKLAFF